MASIALIAEKKLKEEPFLLEALSRKLINYGSLAEEMQEGIEKELGKKVKKTALIMALRRISEKNFEKAKKKEFRLKTELNIKTSLSDLTFIKSNYLVKELPSIYKMIDFDKGDFLNIIHGSYEVNIITNEKYIEKIKKKFEAEKLENSEMDLIAVSMKFGKEFFYTPGVISPILSELAWHNINVYEAISTMTELTVLVKKKDFIRAYEILEEMLKNGK